MPATLHIEKHFTATETVRHGAGRLSGGAHRCPAFRVRGLNRLVGGLAAAAALWLAHLFG
jgi:hypothetical protein